MLLITNSTLEQKMRAVLDAFDVTDHEYAEEVTEAEVTDVDFAAADAQCGEEHRRADRLEAELSRLRPVVEAARAWWRQVESDECSPLCECNDCDHARASLFNALRAMNCGQPSADRLTCGQCNCLTQCAEGVQCGGATTITGTTVGEDWPACPAFQPKVKP